MSRIVKDRIIRGLELALELVGLALLCLPFITNKTKKGK